MGYINNVLQLHGDNSDHNKVKLNDIDYFANYIQYIDYIKASDPILKAELDIQHIERIFGTCSYL